MGIDQEMRSSYLDYAMSVIVSRALPDVRDGLKPVQRRILYSMKNMDDGRFHKVANIIGQTMQYHPHGDQSIGDALVNIGQKGFLIETQGNWGDSTTGDKAAAPRYIESKLSDISIDTVFNKDITNYQKSCRVLIFLQKTVLKSYQSYLEQTPPPRGVGMGG